MARNIIKMAHIYKGYMLGQEKVPILKDVNFEVEEGEFVAILGPSGSGKTTLMNLIGCMDMLDEGEYYLAGTAVHGLEEEDMTQIRNSEIGFIFQNYQLISTYNIEQNIIMPLLIRGMSTAEAREQCREIVKMLGIDHRLRHRPNELSGGQKQRASIARALVSKPAILLADEPTGALDRESGRDVLKLFGELNEMGNTIVMITHDLNVAKAAQRIVYIVDGRLYDSAEEIPQEDK
ncbi:MAG: ABC transporter ATP-binding protein [Eubacteriales bacterium]|nr:ABC transporter ATP-binding protein [Eubacteriales bacterium]